MSHFASDICSNITFYIGKYFFVDGICDADEKFNIRYFGCLGGQRPDARHESPLCLGCVMGFSSHKTIAN